MVDLMTSERPARLSLQHLPFSRWYVEGVQPRGVSTPTHKAAVLFMKRAFSARNFQNLPRLQDHLASPFAHPP